MDRIGGKIMADSSVGAGILSIITESLYDNPIVVFREYVQNSIDSIYRHTGDMDKYEIKIWNVDNNLFFLDNGKGIDKEKFKEEMIKIGDSAKKKQRNLGYKGIGRLSGVPYCKELVFVNIYDYASGKAQIYTIDGKLYEEIKNEDKSSGLSFAELMGIIGTCKDCFRLKDNEDIYCAVQRYDKLLKVTNTGFLVLLQDTSMVLNNTINDDGFFEELRWLLPVDFDEELYRSDQKELFQELTNVATNEVIPARYCHIYYNDRPILRPIQKDMLRDYVCKSNFKYAIGFHTFKKDKIFIDKKNCFSGIKIYIDNMLLCDENELLQNLDHYGLLTHTLNGQLQSVRGIGAMIYITDKVNISANARRTFIEVTDNDSLEFLRMIAEFVNTIYDTRYALSNYVSAKSKQQAGNERLEQLRMNALENLKKLAKEDVELPAEPEDDFFNKSVTEKKKIIKRKISNQLGVKLKEYLKQINTDMMSLDNAYQNFVKWLK